MTRFLVDGEGRFCFFVPESLDPRVTVLTSQFCYFGFFLFFDEDRDSRRAFVCPTVVVASAAGRSESRRLFW